MGGQNWLTKRRHGNDRFGREGGRRSGTAIDRFRERLSGRPMTDLGRELSPPANE
jgi:hypothetical protein